MIFDVVALGELLIDFTQADKNTVVHEQLDKPPHDTAGELLRDTVDMTFTANPGGAPANVLAMLAKLHYRVSLLAKVGPDFFATYLLDQVRAVGIDTSAIVRDSYYHTTLAFVKNMSDGDRDFAFFRQPGADTQLRESDIREALIKNCQIFHFGSLSLTHQPARGTTDTAIALARQYGKLISFDPNLRPSLWNNLIEAREQMAWGCYHADILKISEDELHFLTGEAVNAVAIERLRETAVNLKLIFVTKGVDGAEVYHNGRCIHEAAFLDVKTIDTTGAGDAFLGASLAKILEFGVERLQGVAEDPLGDDELRAILRFANAAAALVTTKRSALMHMPSESAILELMAVDNERSR